MRRSCGAALLVSLAAVGWTACGNDYGALLVEAPGATAVTSAQPGGAGGLGGSVASPGGAGGQSAQGGDAGLPTAGANSAGGTLGGTCGPGLMSCSGSCVSRLNPRNCGGCNNDCTRQGLECINAVCGCRASNECGSGFGVRCDTTQTRCSCGSLCRAGETCRAGAGCGCNGAAACAIGETCCQTPAGCRDLTSDAANCGGCGFACATGQRCVSGSCV
jgi:hypothetical protein